MNIEKVLKVVLTVIAVLLFGFVLFSYFIA